MFSILSTDSILSKAEDIGRSFCMAEKGLRQTQFFAAWVGNLSDILVGCIDAFPPSREEYDADKVAAKSRLQPNMRRLAQELKEHPNIFRALISKAFFDAGQVDYLSVLPSNIKTEESHKKKCFFIFWHGDVVRVLASQLDIQNSKARRSGQMDDLKVIFRYDNKNAGEIEVRVDSDVHYREVKWRMDAKAVLPMLLSELECKKITTQIMACGQAINNFSIP